MRPLGQRFKEHTKQLVQEESEGGHIYIYIKQRASTMKMDQGHHLPTIYSQIILPKPEPTYVTPICDQDL